MRRFTLPLAALLLAIAPVAPLAAAPASGPKPKIVSTENALTLSVEVGKGQLIHLDQPAQSVFVADPDVADVQIKSPNLVFLLGKASGATTLFAVSDDDEVVMSANVVVHYDVARVTEQIHRVAPHSAVSVSTMDDALVLRGTVYSASEAEDIRRVAARYVPDATLLMNKIKVDAPNQIQLRVRVCEVTRNVVKQLGFSWDALTKSGNFLFGLATGAPVVSGGLQLPVTATQFLTRQGSPSADSINVSNVTTNSSVNSAIDALDQVGLLTILAQPNLTAISGQPASFLAGGEFPVPTPSFSGTGVPTISITYKQFGVSLNFVATILENNRINIHVQPEVSELSTQGEVQIAGITVPALATRRAETTIEVGSGQSFAIAGLIQNNVTQTIDRFPWLGDIPVLGTLFRSQNFQRGEDELVIIVTPYIVRPVSTADALQAPTDGYQPPSDKELLLEGPDNRTQVLKKGAAPVGAGGNGLIGPVGFELE